MIKNMSKNLLTNFNVNGFQRKPNIAVLGDIMLDMYLSGNAERISPEAPIPVVDIKKIRYIPGGAANVMNNFIGLGANVWGFGIIGKDKEGEIVLKQLSKKGINTKNIVVASKKSTSLKCRVMVGHHQMIRYDIENIQHISKNYELKFINGIKKLSKKLEFLVIPDYNKGLLTPTLIKKLISISKKNNFKVIADLKIQNIENYSGVDFAKINLPNAKIITNLNSESDNLKKICQKLLKMVKCKNLIITLGKNGMIVMTKNKIVKFPALTRDVYDVTGAGDVMTAVLTTSLANGYDLKTSCEIGTVASAIAVSKVGTYSVTLREIISAINNYKSGQQYEKSSSD